MARQKREGRWIVRLVCLLVLAGVLAAAWYFLSPTLMAAQTSTQYLPYTVEQRDILSSFSFSGTVEILHSQQITAEQGEVVREVYVSDNQTVQKNDKLLQLEGGTVYTANMDGVVNQVQARKGDYAVPGMTLVQVCDLHDLQVTMTVDENDISGLSVGQPCRLYFLALEETFEAVISHIDRVSSSTGATGYYTVSVELAAPENVLPGMQVCVTIPRKQVTGAEALPIEAISFVDGQPVVYTDVGGAMTAQTVTLGLNDESYVQVESGFLPSDTVYAVRHTSEEPEEITLSGLYQKLFGNRIVIREPQHTESDRSAGGGSEGRVSPWEGSMTDPALQTTNDRGEP